MTTKVTIELNDRDVKALRRLGRLGEDCLSRDDRTDLSRLGLRVLSDILSQLPDPDEELVRDMLRVYYPYDAERTLDSLAGSGTGRNMKAVLDLVRERDGR